MAIEDGRDPGKAAGEERLRGRIGPEVEEWILRAMEGLRYGSVEVIIHDAEVIQIERKEKFRFTGKG